MPDPKFVKPWHGIPREQINWHPIVDENACIGCGTCVTGCGRLVYRYDYDKKKAVVADPLNCMVGCMTCANTCPTKAISFPPLDEIALILSKPTVHHAIEDELISRKEQLHLTELIPHNDRIVNMIINTVVPVGSDLLIVTLVPKDKNMGCFCQYMAGQYVEVFVPETEWLSRAYSIGNAPREDGGIELQIRKVEGGRFSVWAFEKMRIDDVIKVRGPLGSFTLSSDRETPLVFIAGGTGFAPIKSIIEQVLKISDTRVIILVWGNHTSDGFYQLDVLESWCSMNPNFKCLIATRNIVPGFNPPRKCNLINKSLIDTIKEVEDEVDFAASDAYVAGPTEMLHAVIGSLINKGISRERIKVDSFGG